MTTNPLATLVIAFLFIVLLAVVFYQDFLKNFIYSRKKFKCLRCGNCCKLKVKLYPEDITKIKKAGYKNFQEGKYLKRINDYCMFLKIDNGKAVCKINDIKPRICEKYPKFSLFNIPRVDTRCFFYHKK